MVENHRFYGEIGEHGVAKSCGNPVGPVVHVFPGSRSEHVLTIRLESKQQVECKI